MKDKYLRDILVCQHQACSLGVRAVVHAVEPHQPGRQRREAGACKCQYHKTGLVWFVSSGVAR